MTFYLDNMVRELLEQRTQLEQAAAEVAQLKAENEQLRQDLRKFRDENLELRGKHTALINQVKSYDSGRRNNRK